MFNPDYFIYLYIITIIYFTFIIIYEYINKNSIKPNILFTFSYFNNYPNIPTKGTNFSCGWDLNSNETLNISPGTRKLVSTGLSILKCPSDIYLRIAPRSSLSCKKIDIGAGVVDCDYRGDLKVLIINNNSETFIINKGDRIAQLIPEKISLEKMYFLDKNDKYLEFMTNINTRGNKGFGSTNK